jgi:transcriptional regulator with XRE-family HTH domain
MSERFTEQLKKAIDASGMTRYAIAKASGVDQAILSRFMRGQQGLTSDSIDKLCDALGLSLTKRRTRKK